MNVKHVIVTGGAKGIGRACVEIFTREGFRVSVLDLDDEAGALLSSEYDLVNFYQCDVSQEAEVDDRIGEAIQVSGEIEYLVCSAGIQRYSTVSTTTEEEWDLVMGTNLKSAFLCAKHCIPSMQKLGKGVILLISSVQAFVSQENAAPYVTSKTAMLGLARSIAIDYAPSIRCVAVCPGTVDTPLLRDAIAQSPDPEAVYQECEEMHLVNRVAKAEEIGELVYFLCSDKAAFITGQAIRVDGGLGAKILGSKRQ